MKIDVMREHIARGKRSDPCACPVALALTEAFGRQAYVQDDIINFPDMDDLTFPMDERVKRFVRLYDLGLGVAPFSFELGLST